MSRPSALRLIARGAVAILIAAAVVVCAQAAFAQHRWTTETDCGVILHPSGVDLEYLADDGRWLTVSRPSQEFTFAGPWSLTFRRADNQRPHTVSGDGCVPPTTTEPPTTTTTEGTTTTWPTTTSQPPTTTGPDATTTSTTMVANSTTATPTTTPTPTTTSLAPTSSVVPTTTTPGSASTSTYPTYPTPSTVSTQGSSTAPAAELPATGLSDAALIAGLVLVSAGGGMVGVSRWRGRRT